MAKHWNWTKNEQQQKKTLCLRVVLEFTHPENDILSGQNFSTNLNRDGFCRQQQKRRGIGKIYILYVIILWTGKYESHIEVGDDGHGKKWFVWWIWNSEIIKLQIFLRWNVDKWVLNSFFYALVTRIIVFCLCNLNLNFNSLGNSHDIV